MKPVPPSVAAFLRCKRIAVAGVSRTPGAPANAIFRRLRDCGYDVVPINPRSAQVEGQPCHADLASVPGTLDAVVVCTHPSDAVSVARQALARGLQHLWFHRSFGAGSVSKEAIDICRAAGVEPIEGGCPLMYCPPVDRAHRFFRWWLHLRHRVPG